jgi:hypothetical protein
MRRASTSACNCSLSDRSCSTASLCLLSRTGAHTGLTSHRASSCSRTEPCRSNTQQQQQTAAQPQHGVCRQTTWDHADKCQSIKAPTFNFHRNSIDIVQGRASHMLCCNVCCLTSNGNISMEFVRYASDVLLQDSPAAHPGTSAPNSLAL